MLAVTVLISSLRIGAEMLPKRLYWTQPDGPRMTRDVTNLTPVLLALEDLHAEAYRNQDWCRNISYSGGAFSNNSESSTCNLFDEPPADFTAAANTDFARIEDALNRSGVWVYAVRQIAYENGRMTHAEFDLVAAPWEFDRWSYIYDPGGPLPEGMENEEVYTRIDADWYFHWEDWM
jgi:hypothetical protein